MDHRPYPTALYKRDVHSFRLYKRPNFGTDEHLINNNSDAMEFIAEFNNGPQLLKFLKEHMFIDENKNTSMISPRRNTHKQDWITAEQTGGTSPVNGAGQPFGTNIPTTVLGQGDYVGTKVEFVHLKNVKRLITITTS